MAWVWTGDDVTRDTRGDSFRGRGEREDCRRDIVGPPGDCGEILGDG